MPIYCDNQATIFLANNLIIHEHTKHTEIDYHSILSWSSCKAHLYSLH